MYSRFIYRLFLICVLFPITISSEEKKLNSEIQIKMEDPNKSKYKKYFDPDKWLLAVTTFAGNTSNQTELNFRSVSISPNGSQPKFFMGKKSEFGEGPGGGLQASALYKNWFFMNVAFGFNPYDNQDKIKLYNTLQDTKTEVTGNVTLIRYTWNIENKIQPFAGMYYFSGIGAHNHTEVKNFILYSDTTNSYASYPKVTVDVYVRDPAPQIGVTFKLPIQNWSISPYYSYGFETADTYIKSTAGQELVSNPFNLYNDFFYAYKNPSANSTLLPVNFHIRRNYFSHRGGLQLFFDYRRFISLRLTAQRDLKFNRWILNGYFNLFFTKHFAISAVAEYSERSISTIRYWIIGPTFVLQF